MLETPSRMSTLPVIRTPMLGRERETTEIRGLMRDPAVRLVTIIGPGGVGKTRLAIGAVSSVDDDVDVVFVPLAAVREPERIVPAIGQAIGLTPKPGNEGEPELFQELGQRLTVLVLDNLEQIPGVAPVLSRLLAHVPGLTVLATSQVAVEVPGEHLFVLAPLPVPDVAGRDAHASDAVALFLERARAVDPLLPVDADALMAIADICRRLDGLPLAIELAAARANLLSPQALRERLDNRFGMLASQRDDLDERHRTLRAAISWTYDLLDPTEQALFRRLAVFAGGVSPDGAEAVFTPSDDRSVAEVLQSLVRRSMLQPSAGQVGESRYLLLESLREFGLDQLVRLEEEDDARLAHAAWIAALAEEAEPHLGGRDQALWFTRLDAEMENLRLAVRWSLERHHSDVVLRITGALWPFLRERSLVEESREWLRRALERSSPAAAPYRAKALIAAGNFAHDHRDIDVAQAYFEQARSLALATGDVQTEIDALYGLGHVASGKARFAESLKLNQQGLERASQIGHRRLIATGEANLGVTAFYQGKAQDAIDHCMAAAVILKELGDASGEALMLSNIGGASILTGDLARAEDCTRRAIALQRELRTRTRLLSSLNNMGLIFILQEKFDDARAVLMEALEMHREDGDISGQSHITHSLANVELEDRNIPGAATWFLDSLDLVLETGDVSGIIHYVHLLLSICSVHGDHADAVILLAAHSRIRDEAGYELNADDQAQLNQVTEAARSALDDDAFRRNWSRGNVMDVAEVIERMPIIARRIIGRRVEDPQIAWPEDAPSGDGVAPGYRLTSRELEVLRLIGAGKSTQEISTELSVSPRTVSTHVANVMAKLDVTSRTAAVARALRDGVIEASPQGSRGDAAHETREQRREGNP